MELTLDDAHVCVILILSDSLHSSVTMQQKIKSTRPILFFLLEDTGWRTVGLSDLKHGSLTTVDFAAQTAVMVKIWTQQFVVWWSLTLKQTILCDPEMPCVCVCVCVYVSVCVFRREKPTQWPAADLFYFIRNQRCCYHYNIGSKFKWTRSSFSAGTQTTSSTSIIWKVYGLLYQRHIVFPHFLFCDCLFVT